ncbi:MAG: 30S ribosomal protein S13 [Planctomycetota bacterium]
MPRLLGVDIPAQRPTAISLTYLYGIGRTTASKLCEQAGIDPTIRAKDLTDDEVMRLTNLIENNHMVEGQLRRQIQENIKRLKEIRCYRGLRHVRNLPLRGQRTRTNARTRKGPKRMVVRKKGLKA